MRTTLDIPDPLFREVKTRAVQQGVKLKDLLARYIEAGLKAPQTSEVISAMVKHYPLPVAFERVAGAPKIPNRTNAELYALLDQGELGEYFRVIEESRSTV